MSSRKLDSETRGSRQAPAIDTTLTCMFVAPVTDPGSGWPISSWQEESCTFHSEEAFADAAREKTKKGSEEKSAVFKKETREVKSTEYMPCSFASNLDQIILLGKNFPSRVSTANIQSITENNTNRETLKSRTYAGATLPAEVQPEQAEGINLWLHFRFESQDDRSTFLNGDE